MKNTRQIFCSLWIAIALLGTAWAQLPDQTMAPNAAKVGIAKSLQEEVGAGRGDVNTPDSSIFIISRDPFRSIRRGRQLFQRKFTRTDGQGPANSDGVGDIGSNIGIGAGLADSCALCHGRPRGSGGVGGNVVTRPDSRDAGHLFGLGLKEMLADEITGNLRTIRTQALASAAQSHRNITMRLSSKGIRYGSITAKPDGTVDTSQVQGVDPDLRVRPFFAQGGTISIREFIVGALHNEMGLEVNDPDLADASSGHRVVTPSGMVLDGNTDNIEAPPPPDALTGRYDLDPALVDHLEFYLLNYFKPGSDQQNMATQAGLRAFNGMGCESCHVQNLTINHDRRVADVTTVYDSAAGAFNSLFATAVPLFSTVPDATAFPTLKKPQGNSFFVQNIFTDFKRHDLGPNFWERNFDGTLQKQFMTRALWGVGSTSPFGHDGRSISLDAVIRRHGGEALPSRNAYVSSDPGIQALVQVFLNSLILFPPDDTASNLDPAVPSTPNFPQAGHGSIKLSVLFNDPGDPE